LLGGCWAGPLFYTDADLAAPLRPGVYALVEPDGTDEQPPMRISIRRDGYTRLDPTDGSEGDVHGFARLPGAEGLYVSWGHERDDDVPGGGTIYSLLDARDGRYRLLMPLCSETRRTAEAAGARFVEDPKVPVCRFARRQALESALIALAERPGSEWLRLEPIERAQPR
jgi:hypothetical protein